MTPYIRNRNCRCVRCQASGLMGAAILITLGILFLLDNYGALPFNETIPVLLLVIGGVLLISRTGSTEGHVQPGWIQGQPAPPAPQAWTYGATPPPPQPEQSASSAGNPPSSSEQSDLNDSQVKP